MKQEEADVIFSMSDYIMQVKEREKEKIYIDNYMNILENEDDMLLVKNYKFSKTLFLYMNQNIFLDTVDKVQKIRDANKYRA